MILDQRTKRQARRHNSRTLFVISTIDTHTLPSWTKATNTLTHLVWTKQLRSDEHSVHEENQRQQSTHKNVNNTLDIVSGKKTPAHPAKQPNHTQHNSLPVLTHTTTQTTCSKDKNEKEENTFLHTHAPTAHQHRQQQQFGVLQIFCLNEQNKFLINFMVTVLTINKINI